MGLIFEEDPVMMSMFTTLVGNDILESVLGINNEVMFWRTVCACNNAYLGRLTLAGRPNCDYLKISFNLPMSQIWRPKEFP